MKLKMRRDHKWFFIVLLITLPAFIIALVKIANAQPSNCADRDTIISNLATKFSEAPVSVGLAANGKVVEILASKDGRTWTMLQTASNGTSCVVANGYHWKKIPILKGDPV